MPSLIPASMKILKKAGRIEGVSTTKHIGRLSLEEHPVTHQPPPILPLSSPLLGRDRTSDSSSDMLKDVLPAGSRVRTKSGSTPESPQEKGRL